MVTSSLYVPLCKYGVTPGNQIIGTKLFGHGTLIVEMIGLSV